MNEEDTYKRLKGLTIEEAKALCQEVFQEAAKSMEADGIDVTNGIPIFLLRHEIDEKLKPYGLSYDVIFPHMFGDLS